MKQGKNVWVVGGDLRQSKLAELMAEDGHTVCGFGLGQATVPQADSYDGIAQAQCVVLPLPLEGEGGLNCPQKEGDYPLEPLLDALVPDQVICAGKVSATVVQMAATRGLVIHDYFAREELTVANAIPTVLTVA